MNSTHITDLIRFAAEDRLSLQEGKLDPQRALTSAKLLGVAVKGMITAVRYADLKAQFPNSMTLDYLEPRPDTSAK